MLNKNYARVFVSDDVMRYIVRIVEVTRQHSEIMLGVSPREPGLAKAAQVYAILQGRDYVSPDDIKKMAKQYWT